MSQTQVVFQSSDLSRNSSKVFRAAEKSPILVTRRDGEGFILMSESEAKARKTLLEFASDLIAIATDDRGSLSFRMMNRFPWMRALSEDARETCAKELINAARASFVTEQPQLAAVELNAWRETASAIELGLDKQLVDWLEEPIPVVRPE